VGEDQPERGEAQSFVQDIGLSRDLSEGPIATTGNYLDLAISGNAYFSVQTPDEASYTRHGRFQLDAQGQIVNGQGNAVLSAGGGPITVPSGSGTLIIAADGTVSSDTQTLGKIGLFEFADQTALKRGANGLYTAGEAQPQAATDSEIVQGALEQSNVQAIVEITRMIDVQRSYQSAQRLIKSEHDQSMRAINKLLRMRQS
jgi:flagellar basal-body rod protein FlgF